VAIVPVACASTLPRHAVTIGRGQSNDPWLLGEPCSKLTAAYPALPTETIAKGQGDPIEDGETVRIHYVASLPNGKVVHDTHDDNMPSEIILGSTKMACGFARAVAGMQPGEERRVTVPAGLLRAPSDTLALRPKDTDLVLVIDMYLPAGTSPFHARTSNTNVVVRSPGLSPDVIVLPGQKPVYPLSPFAPP
jgi:FKBP-type peptidyl-prolyl cis-trans isomerase